MKENDTEQFEELDFDRQCDIVAHSPLAEKADLITRSQYPDKMINTLSPEELFIISKEADTETVPELLQYANLDQITFFGDMIIWKKDEVTPSFFVDFIDNLMEADTDQLALWLTTVELEVLITGFQKLLTVFKAEDTEDIVEDRLDDRVFFTIDGYYYLAVGEKNFDVVKRTLEILYSSDPHLYIVVIEGVMSESLFEMEEIAHTHRQERLSEKGFPEPDEAYRIYRTVSAEEWTTLEKRELTTPLKTDVLTASVLNPQDNDRLFFDTVLLSLFNDSVEIKASLQDELVGIANKIASVSGTEFLHEKELKKGIEQAHAFINIGLELVSKRDLLKAREIISNYWLEDIFRLGYTQILVLRDKVQKLYKKAGFGSIELFKIFFDQPYQGIVTGLLQNLPKFCPPESIDTETAFRDFFCLDELYRTDQIISNIHWIINRLSEHVPDWYKKLQQFSEQFHPYDAITLSTILLTIFMHFVKKGKLILAPVSMTQFKQFLQISDCYRKKVISDAETAYIQSFIRSFSGENDSLGGFAYLSEIIRKNREEYFLISPHGDIDIRFLSFYITNAETERDNLLI